MKNTALIMAGGRGERFWPRSRASMPKQFLSLTADGKTMIQQTVERLLPLVEIEDIYIATNRGYRELIREQLPELPAENVLCEPVGRNTAPCIGLAAEHIAKKYEDAVMFVLPSDHIVRDQQLFRQILIDARDVAAAGDWLVTVGVTPTYPETGYGYIKFCPDERIGQAYAVERFVEKPDLETAQSYVSSQQYLWNSGMFIWRVSTVLKSLREHMPETFAGLERIGAAIGTQRQEEVLEREFQAFRSVSIDYGVMEKADNIYILAGSFGWDDVGSWLALERLQQHDGSGNVVKGNVVSVHTKNSIIQGENKLIAAVGVEDLVIIDTDDALLVCAKNSTGEIKKVIEALKADRKTDYL